MKLCLPCLLLFGSADRIYLSTKVDRHERDTGNTMDTKDIRTVVAKVVDINTGESIEPVYEAYGYEKFQQFVDYYRRQNYINKIVWVRGFGYNDENGASQVLATEFVGVGTYE